MDWQPIFHFVKRHDTSILQEIATLILSLLRMEIVPSDLFPSCWVQELIILLKACSPQSYI